MRLLVALGVVVLLVFSGCLQDATGAAGAPHGTSGTDGDGTTSSAQGPTSGAGSSTPPPTGGGGGGNGSGPPPQFPPWPPVGSATIRPGVQTTVGNSQCTSNFLYRTPDNATLFLGVAAHCVENLKPGAKVGIQGASKPGVLAYSAWHALNLTCSDPDGCTGGQFTNDFALIAIDPADRSKVHPALLQFGGPTALKDSRQLAVGDRVLGYGNSGLWMGVQPLKWHEGVVSATQPAGGNQFRTLTAPPGIFGDSGSAIITKSGEAVGVLATVCLAPCTGQNGVVGVTYQLELAQKTTGVTYELVTAARLNGGLLP
jgi:hypothetical protein